MRYLQCLRLNFKGHEQYLGLPSFMGDYKRPAFKRLRIRLGVHKRMEWNDHKGIEINGMYLSKGKEWKRM